MQMILMSAADQAKSLIKVPFTKEYRMITAAIISLITLIAILGPNA